MHENNSWLMRIRSRVTRQNRLVRYLKQQCNTVIALQSICLCVIVFGFIEFNRIQWERIRKNRTSSSRLRGGPILTTQLREQWITDTDQPFNYNNSASSAKHLIVVAGHSVTVSGHLEDADHDEHDWYLLDYQKRRGLPEAIIAHISAGIEQAAIDADSLLIFSGGQTRSTIGPESEGSSYYRVADAMQLWEKAITTSAPGTVSAKLSMTTTSSKPIESSEIIVDNYPGRSTVRARTITEEFATDSFENLYVFST